MPRIWPMVCNIVFRNGLYGAVLLNLSFSLSSFPVYLLFEGKILFQGTPEELAENPVVREKYLGTNFVLRRKDFQLAEKDRQGKNV